MATDRCPTCRSPLQFEEADYEDGTARKTCQTCGVEFLYERGRFTGWKLVKAKRIKQPPEEKKGA